MKYFLNWFHVMVTKLKLYGLHNEKWNGDLRARALSILIYSFIITQQDKSEIRIFVTKSPYYVREDRRNSEPLVYYHTRDTILVQS